MGKYKIIDGFERYAVGEDGSVINRFTGHVINPRKATGGYLRVNLRTGNEKYEKPKSRTVHRLVAEAFLEPIPGKNFVNHIDGDKTNNHVDNLEWCTAQENTRHALRLGLLKSDYRKMNLLSRKHSDEAHRTEQYAEKMRKINRETGVTKRVFQVKDGVIVGVYDNCHDAARSIFGEKAQFKDRAISSCARGKLKSAYGYQWVYEKREVMSP